MRYFCNPSLRWSLGGSKALHCLHLCWQLEGSADDRSAARIDFVAALDMSDDVESNVACDYDSIRETASAEKIRPQQDKAL